MVVDVLKINNTVFIKALETPTEEEMNRIRSAREGIRSMFRIATCNTLNAYSIKVFYLPTQGEGVGIVYNTEITLDEVKECLNDIGIEHRSAEIDGDYIVSVKNHGNLYKVIYSSSRISEGFSYVYSEDIAKAIKNGIEIINF